MTATPIEPSFVTLKLTDLLGRKEDTLKLVYDDLCDKGWALVRLDELTQNTVRQCVEPLQAFFALSKEEKMKLHVPPIWGYSSVDHKESLRILTASRWKEVNLPRESSIYFPMWSLVKILDTVMESLVEATAMSWFGKDAETLGKELDIPFLQREDAAARFSMLDVANYFNLAPLPISLKIKSESGKRDEPLINCAPHFDPGLLSLSFLSTSPGLELQHPTTGKWFAPPSLEAGKGAEGVAILWAGQAASTATNGRIKPAIHRVVFPSSLPAPPRLAIWYEICTAAQEPKLPSISTTTTTATPKPQPVQPQFDTPAVFPAGVQAPYALSPKKDEGQKAFGERLERFAGVPMTKAYIPPSFMEDEINAAAVPTPLNSNVTITARAPAPLNSNSNSHRNSNSNRNNSNSINNDKKKKKKKSNKAPGIVGDYRPQPKAGEHPFQFATRLERDLGVPMSKSGIEFRRKPKLDDGDEDKRPPRNY